MCLADSMTLKTHQHLQQCICIFQQSCWQSLGKVMLGHPHSCSPVHAALCNCALSCCLQVFRGCLLGTDILNYRNTEFWSHQQPAYNLRRFISCAGTNFLIRASAFREAGAL